MESAAARFNRLWFASQGDSIRLVTIEKADLKWMILTLKGASSRVWDLEQRIKENGNSLRASEAPNTKKRVGRWYFAF